jgi:hypothetical protein
MRIIAFRATGLAHRRQLGLEFNDDLTILTGVNGSGKTTVLASVIALLSPNLEALASINYDKIEVELSINRKRILVRAEKVDGAVNLGVSGSREVFRFPIFEDGYLGPETIEARSRYYTDLLATSASTNPILRKLADIPTPMFLGLDRRYRGSLSARARLQSRQMARRRKRNVFGSSLGDYNGSYR